MYFTEHVALSKTFYLGFFFLFLNTSSDWGFPGGSEVKESSLPMQEIGDADSVPGSGRSPGKPFQYSCLENPTDRATS